MNKEKIDNINHLCYYLNIKENVEENECLQNKRGKK